MDKMFYYSSRDTITFLSIAQKRRLGLPFPEAFESNIAVPGPGALAGEWMMVLPAGKPADSFGLPSDNKL